MTILFPSNVCGEYEERIGMIESTDRGVTWQFMGHADFHASWLNPVDPSVLFDDGLLVFYFLDLMSLNSDTTVIYRSVALDESGLSFLTPAGAFEYPGDCTDPALIHLPDDRYRMYVQSHRQTAIISATSEDGHQFSEDTGERTKTGGVPGALVLSDGRVRLFVCGEGITSLISDNGLDFTEETGVRISVPVGAEIVADPHPVRIADGTYRMVYKVRPTGQGESPYLDEVHLAESTDALNWTPGSASLVTGSVPTLVELPDGRWRIYYVDFKTDEPAGFFTLVQTIQVTPDEQFLTGSFARINYVPAIDRFAVTFGTKGSTEKGNCKGAGYAYKEYTTELQETGKAATFTWNPDACEANDSGSCMKDNTYYFVHVPTEAGMPYGWRITAFDAVSWSKLAERIVPLLNPNESNLDPSVAFINGQLDVSDQYNPSGKWQEGGDSHHRFFSSNLDSLGYIILDDAPHVSGASMIDADGIIHIISADEYTGDLYVLKYDHDWNYLESKMLMEQAHWAQGVACDGERFYVSYMNTSQRTDPGFFPVHLNVRLAAFDLNWNLVADTAVTDFKPADNKQPGRPWVIFHNNRLFVSYDCDSIDAATGEEMLNWQAIVKAYEIEQGLTSIDGSNDHTIVPKDYSLGQNYPNPFNPDTMIRFELPESVHVRLSIYDLLGKEIAVLLNERCADGVHEVRWDGLDGRNVPVSTGLYFIRLEAGDYRNTVKVMMMR